MCEHVRGCARQTFASATRALVVRAGAAACSKINTLDLSANKLCALDVASLPRQLQKLIVAGNQLLELPHDLATLQHLTSLTAGCNRLRNADVVFACPALVHASLCYNQLADLQCSAASVCNLPSEDSCNILDWSWVLYMSAVNAAAEHLLCMCCKPTRILLCPRSSELAVASASASVAHAGPYCTSMHSAGLAEP